MSTSAVLSPPTAAGGSASLGAATALVCRECGTCAPLGLAYACAECFGPLEVAYDYPRLRREDITAGPASLWRYAALLPVPQDPAARPRDLAPGWTPLRRADRLAAELGLRCLWLKDETANPTHSFKDRVVAVALASGWTFGVRTLAAASTGNLAQAVAAAAARAGLPSVVFVPADLEAGKTVSTAAYGGTLVAVEGSYDDVNRLVGEVAGQQDWGFVNVTLRPFYAEGSKTVGFEVAEQLGWRLPEQVVVPVASGALLTKVDKGLRELVSLGLVEPTPCRVFGAQATGCSPVSAAFAAGQDVVRPVRPATLAKSLAIGDPADGSYALDVVRRTGGAVTDVSDEEVVAAIRLLARTEGVFTETAGGVSVACLARLVAEGRLDPDAETVVLITGDGLKTLDALDGVGPSVTVAASLGALRSAGVA